MPYGQDPTDPQQAAASQQAHRKATVTQAPADPEGMGNLPSGEGDPREAAETASTNIRKTATGLGRYAEESGRMLAQGVRDLPRYAYDFAGDLFKSLLPTEEGARAGGRVLGRIGDIATAVDPGVQLPGAGRMRPRVFEESAPEVRAGPLAGRPQLGQQRLAPGGLVTGQAAGLDVRPPMGGQPQAPAPSGPLPPSRQLPAPQPVAGARPYAQAPFTRGAAPAEGPPLAVMPRRTMLPGEPMIPAGPTPARGGQPGDVFRGKQEISEPAPTRPLIRSDAHEGEPSHLASALVDNNANAISQSLMRRYRYAVNPKLAPGRQNWQGITSQERQIQGSVDDIVRSKEELRLWDARDRPLPQGSTPKNLRQWVQAIDQMRGKLYGEYTQLAQRTGQQGVRVDLNPLADKMWAEVNTPTNQVMHPELINRVEREVAELRARGSMSPVEAQNMLQDLYQQRRTFTGSQERSAAPSGAVLDASIPVLRDTLHQTMETALAGPQYAALRQRYANLASTEADIAKAFKRKAGQLEGGLAEALARPAAIINLLHGIGEFAATGSARGLARSAAIFAGERLNRLIISPNAAVDRIFRERERAMRPSIPERLSSRAAVELGQLRQQRYNANRLGDMDEYQRLLNR